MNKILLPLVMLLCATVSACTSKEQVYNSLYEGLHAREQIINETSDPVPSEHPRYDEYRRERDEIMRSNNQAGNSH